MLQVGFVVSFVQRRCNEKILGWEKGRERPWRQREKEEREREREAFNLTLSIWLLQQPLSSFCSSLPPSLSFASTPPPSLSPSIRRPSHATESKGTHIDTVLPPPLSLALSLSLSCPPQSQESKAGEIMVKRSWPSPSLPPFLFSRVGPNAQPKLFLP